MQVGDDAFNAGVVGCYAVADEAEGGGHAFEDIDADAGVLGGGGFHKAVRGVDTCWARADDGDAEGSGHNYFFYSRGQSVI